eukprot:CAMPEP_0194755472 /NCGR_PEP_ID=MMETSP0323_2-20130528/9341_1 /TAXON_ID=2866 ORGANISM="Crypthecodinium cohnii, Strain Seligo" /NCGR_SAMPLE_ID=MMETSP0323_2 /ASSEMBLY_ACC=CAM_ASM_000346 /LENGTH=127 /DNA_ID=CAMNT_0039674539 /DNA_START=167 /DNA_END=551 /DNA_ORIENTATION=+
MEAKAVCSGESLVLSVDTLLWTSPKYAKLVDAVMDFVSRHHLHLIWFPESWHFPDLPQKCSDQSPSSCALQTKNVKANNLAIFGPAVDKYKNRTDLTIIYDTDYDALKTIATIGFPNRGLQATGTRT